MDAAAKAKVGGGVDPPENVQPAAAKALRIAGGNTMRSPGWAVWTLAWWTHGHNVGLDDGSKDQTCDAVRSLISCTGTRPRCRN